MMGLVNYFWDAMNRPLSTVEQFQVGLLAFILIGLPLCIIAFAVQTYREYHDDDPDIGDKF